MGRKPLLQSLSLRSSSVSSGFGVQLDTERVHDLQDGTEAGISLAGQCLVKAFASQPRILSALRHAFGSGNVAERRRDEGGIVTGLGHAGLQVHHHVFLRLEVFDGIPFTQFFGSHVVLSLELSHSETPSPTGSQSPKLPSSARRIFAWIRFWAILSRSPTNQSSNISVVWIVFIKLIV